MKPVTKQRGLSLVELMVAMVIGLILIAGIVQIFVGSRQTYALSDGLARLQENGRFGMDFLTRDIRMSGQAGCSFNRVTSLLNPPGDMFLPFDLATRISGLEYQGTDAGDTLTIGSPAPGDAAASDWADNAGNDLEDFLPGLAGRMVPGSDVIFTRSARSVSGIVPSAPTAAGVMIVNITSDPADLDQGDLAVIGDCEQANLFQNSAADDDASVGRGSPCGGRSPCNVTAGTTWTSDWDASARIFRFSSKAYFVALSDRDGDGNPDPGQAGLWEADFSRGTPAQRRELVEGVENMQVLYGVDADGGPERSVTQYVAADNVPDWRDVLSVRVALLMRSADEVPVEPDTREYELLATDNSGGNAITIDPADERRARQVFATTVAVRNAVMRTK